MYLSEFRATNFRNLSNFQLELTNDLNIVVGDNAAGKSSLLESIAYLVSGRSFRTSKQGLLISHNADDFTLFARFSDDAKIGVNYQRSDKSKRIKLNGEVIRSLSLVASLYPVQVLSPESYHLIDSGPLERRKYLDWLLFHVEHSYHNCWIDFNRLLKQRNAYLRSSQQRISKQEIESWNAQYVQSAAIIDKQRSRIASLLLPSTKNILRTVNFEHTEELTISYYSGHTGSLLDKLRESQYRDLASGNTQYGPHKSDLRLKIGKYLAKDILSRGQKKLLVNALYLAQTEVLKKQTKKNSLFIIDDFSSELDKTNQLSLIRALRDQDDVQIILSCLQADMIKPLIKEYNSVKMFHVEHGTIRTSP